MDAHATLPQRDVSPCYLYAKPTLCRFNAIHVDRNHRPPYVAACTAQSPPLSVPAARLTRTDDQPNGLTHSLETPSGLGC
jgi:hypothetical protein